jgi:hypothetical protein
VRVRSGEFFDDDDPSEIPLSIAMKLLLVTISVIATATFAALVLLARMFLMATGR